MTPEKRANEILAKLLAEHFEMSFQRPWDDLPPHTTAHWREVASELMPEFLNAFEEIVDEFINQGMLEKEESKD